MGLKRLVEKTESLGRECEGESKGRQSMLLKDPRGGISLMSKENHGLG